MNQKKQHVKKTATAALTSKKPYHAPELRKFGTLASLTAKSSFGGDRTAKKT